MKSFRASSSPPRRDGAAAPAAKVMLLVLALAASGVLAILAFCYADDSTDYRDLFSSDLPPTPTADLPDRCSGRNVYVHRLPPRFNADMLRDCYSLTPAHDMCPRLTNAGLGPAIYAADTGGVIASTGWHNTFQFTLEVIFHNRMQQYDCLTANSSMADAVFVPYYAALEVRRRMFGFNETERNALSVDLMNWLTARPEWAAMGGRDHFVVAAKTTYEFRELGNDNRTWGGNSFLNLPAARNMTALVLEVSPQLPRGDFAIPYPSYFHPRTSSEVASWQEKVRNSTRTWLFVFAGGRRPSSRNKIRNAAIQQCAESPACKLLECAGQGKKYNNCDAPGEQISLFASSKFCLQPAGDTETRKSAVDSVMLGCIPVFFSLAAFHQQYGWYVRDHENPREYSVIIPPEDVEQGKVRIEEVLRRYSGEQVAAMREKLISMMPRFLYKDPRSEFDGEMEDAFDVMVAEVLRLVRKARKESGVA